MDTTVSTELYPAFKEWAAIVEALGAGEQILLLRKGGIAEGRGGFQLKNQHFWLYPTYFHAQLDQTKPAAGKFFARAEGNGSDASAAGSGAARDATTPVTLSYFARVVENNFVGEWPRIQALDAQHLWKEALLRERFEWSKPPGLHVIAVRVYAAVQPYVLKPTEAMLGCKSWVEVPCELNAANALSKPVLNDADFEKKLQALRGA